MKLVLFQLISKTLMRCFRIQKIRFQMNAFSEFDLVLKDSLHQFYLIELFFLTYLELFFFHIFDREKMKGTKKENEEAENSVLFFSIFLNPNLGSRRKREKDNLFFMKKQCLRLQKNYSIRE